MSEDPSLHSRRSLTLRFDIPISKTKEFWESLRRGVLVTTKCAKCGNVTFPPQADCPRCMNGGFVWTELGTDAELVTFTQVRVAPSSFSDKAPYLIAIGQLRDGLKVLAWLEGADGPKPGMKLKLEARKSREGNPYYVFVPA